MSALRREQPTDSATSRVLAGSCFATALINSLLEYCSDNFPDSGSRAGFVISLHFSTTHKTFAFRGKRLITLARKGNGEEDAVPSGDVGEEWPACWSRRTVAFSED